MLISDTIRLFLDSLGRSEEYEYYLSRFYSNRSPSFSVFCPDLDTCKQAQEGIKSSLRFLLRLELNPAVLLSGPFCMQAYECLKEKEEEQSAAMYHVFIVKNQVEDKTLLRNSLQEASKIARKKQVCLLILWPQKNVEEALLAVSHLSHRLYLLRMQGEICNQENKPYYHYSFAKEFSDEEQGTEIHSTDHAILSLSRSLLSSTETLHLSVVSPYNFLKEIFTVKGAGTIFRKPSTILYYQDINSVDTSRLLRLFKQSFSKKIRSDNFLEHASHFYIEKDYQGALILEEHHDLGLYLSKFAVGIRARGLGIATELWQELQKHNDKIFWRSRNTNAMIRWYTDVCDGFWRDKKWTVFWKNIPTQSVSTIVNFCLQLPDDFY